MSNATYDIHRYIGEKINMGLVEAIAGWDRGESSIGVYIYGVSPRIWTRVLEPEIRRIADVVSVKVHNSSCIEVAYK